MGGWGAGLPETGRTGTQGKPAQDKLSITCFRYCEVGRKHENKTGYKCFYGPENRETVRSLGPSS